jgi:hypothetical protein
MSEGAITGFYLDSGNVYRTFVRAPHGKIKTINVKCQAHHTIESQTATISDQFHRFYKYGRVSERWWSAAFSEPWF